MTFLNALISAIFYRFGGWGQEGRDSCPFLAHLIDPLTRRMGCAFLVIAQAVLMHFTATPIAWVLTFICTYGALTTYWDYMFRGKDNFYMHGAMLGIALFPLVYWGSVPWHLFLIRTAFLSISMGAWSSFWGIDWVEEGGRGFLLIASMTILGG